jgi:preprotein translocase subunit Sec61beta
MVDQPITTPSGMGGLQHFNEEYNSKMQIPPEAVIWMVGIVIVAMGVLKYVY